MKILFLAAFLFCNFASAQFTAQLDVEDAPPPQQAPAKFLANDIIWWGDLSVAVTQDPTGNVGIPVPFGYVGIIKNPMTLARIPGQDGKIKSGWTVVVRLSPFGIPPFQKMMEDPNGPM